MIFEPWRSDSCPTPQTVWLQVRAQESLDFLRFHLHSQSIRMNSTPHLAPELQRAKTINKARANTKTLCSCRHLQNQESVFFPCAALQHTEGRIHRLGACPSSERAVLCLWQVFVGNLRVSFLFHDPYSNISRSQPGPLRKVLRSCEKPSGGSHSGMLSVHPARNTHHKSKHTQKMPSDFAGFVARLVLLDLPGGRIFFAKLGVSLKMPCSAEPRRRLWWLL